jgi:hypothetical protein
MIYKLLNKLGKFPADTLFEGESTQELSVIQNDKPGGINQFLTVTLGNTKYFEPVEVESEDLIPTATGKLLDKLHLISDLENQQEAQDRATGLLLAHIDNSMVTQAFNLAVRPRGGDEENTNTL